jgi:hypothetical protein
MRVFLEREGEWQIVAFQATAVPVLKKSAA